MTHAELVQRAAKWLHQKHAVVITELSVGGHEEPDALGFRMGFTTMVECKVSRSDYYSDRRKRYERTGDFRYYLTPSGLLKGLEITEGWGLLEVRGKKVYKIVDAPRHVDKDWKGEAALLLSCFRRLGKPRPEAGVMIDYYRFMGEEPPKRRATVGVSDSVYAD